MLRMCVSTVFGLRKSALGDLRVRLAIDDEPRDLELSLCQRFDADPVGLARAAASVDRGGQEFGVRVRRRRGI